MDKPLKLVIMDGAFDGLDQDEIDDIMVEMQQMIDSGELLEQSTPVDMDELAEEDPELYALLVCQLNKADPSRLH